jgi:uncharacterized protein YuzE
MTLQVRYDAEVDILTVWTGQQIATSSTVEDSESLIVDFGAEDGLDVVGFELLGAAKLLAPYFSAIGRERIDCGKTADTDSGHDDKQGRVNGAENTPGKIVD